MKHKDSQMNILRIFGKTTRMKKLLIILFVGALGFTACKKDEPTPAGSPETTYANRLNGSWNVSSLTYNATLSLGGFPIPIQGTAQNAGTLSFNTPTRFCNYNIKFLPSLPIPIDTVRLVGAGNWTNTAGTVTVVDTATQQTIVFTATTNTDAVQIMTTVVNYQLDSVTVVPVTMNFTLTK
jgi:hypothetical protein